MTSEQENNPNKYVKPVTVTRLQYLLLRVRNLIADNNNNVFVASKAEGAEGHVSGSTLVFSKFDIKEDD